MFTKKKKNYRTFIFTVIIIMMCFLIIAVAWPQEPEENLVNTNVGTDSPKDNGNQSTENPSDIVNSNQNNNNNNNIDYNDKNNIIPEQKESYYIVKRAGENIIVYFYNDDGEVVELEKTHILYELLGPDDQNLFDEGIRVENQEELATLLQDFES